MPFPNIPKIPDFRKLHPRFGDLLRDYRTLQGKTIEELATKVSVTPTALAEIEEGKRGAPPMKVVKALAAALDLSGEDKGDFIDSAEMESPALSALFGAGGIFGQNNEQEQLAPPAAIFVFLIADIRGYTSYTAREGDEAAAELSQAFARMAREVMRQRQGRLVEVRGDEVLGAFASARQAVQAAAEMHDQYAKYAIAHPGTPSGIGVGLDVGEAVQVDDGFRGAALNRASRLCKLAAPGETLVSPGVVFVASRVKGVRFEPRGQEYLKGFAEPVTILLAAPAEVVDAELVEDDDEDYTAGK